MKRHIKYLLFIAAIFGMGSCSTLSEKFDPEDPTLNDVGTLSLATPIVSFETRASEVSDFEITILDADGISYKYYEKYSEMPEVVTLPVGDYSVEAASPGLEDAAWDAPYYFGSEGFTIEKNRLTVVENLTCELANIMVRVGYTDDMYALLGEDVVVTVTIGDGTLEFPATDTTATGYFKSIEDENVMVAVLSGTVNGQPVKSAQAFADVKAGEYRRILYSFTPVDDENNDENGIVVVNGADFVVDGTCDVVDFGDIVVVVPEGEIEDTPEASPSDGGTTDGGGDGGDDNPGEQVGNAPIIYGVDFDIDSPVYTDETSTVVVKIYAENTLEDVSIVIESTTLTPEELESVGMVAEFTLANPGENKRGESLADALSGLGFPVEDEVVGHTEITFDVSQFMTLIQILGSGTSMFHITPIDACGLTSNATLTIIAR